MLQLRAPLQERVWMKSGWSPFICSHSHEAGLNVGYCRVEGTFHGNDLTLYITIRKLPALALIQAKASGINKYEVSILGEDTRTGQVRSESYKAFTNPLEASAWCSKNSSKQDRSRKQQLLARVSAAKLIHNEALPQNKQPVANFQLQAIATPNRNAKSLRTWQTKTKKKSASSGQAPVRIKPIATPQQTVMELAFKKALKPQP
jgi:hypothetical protein